MVRIGGKGMSYIVKNCPAFDNRIWIEPTCNINPCDCENITDCVIKRVIEIAKDIIEKDCYENSDAKAEKILQLFDLEEINK